MVILLCLCRDRPLGRKPQQVCDRSAVQRFKTPLLGRRKLRRDLECGEVGQGSPNTMQLRLELGGSG